MTRRLCILGLGYCGLAIARRARAEGWSVAGTCTGDDKAMRLRSAGIEAHRFDGSGALPAAALDGATHVLCTIAPGRDGDPALAAGGPGSARWLGYLSTTGVYGDSGGDWVDEESPLRPTQPRSVARLAAERAWRETGRRIAAEVDLFRLPGIYGPGRSVLERVRAGTAQRIDKPGQVFSRIHVDDVAAAVMAALRTPHRGTVFNVADDLPASTAEVVAFACALLGRPLPPLVPWQQAEPTMSAMARSFYAESRRVRNLRVKRELGLRLLYPTYREGLRAIAAAGFADRDHGG